VYGRKYPQSLHIHSLAQKTNKYKPKVLDDKMIGKNMFTEIATAPDLLSVLDANELSALVEGMGDVVEIVVVPAELLLPLDDSGSVTMKFINENVKPGFGLWAVVLCRDGPLTESMMVCSPVGSSPVLEKRGKQSRGPLSLNPSISVASPSRVTVYIGERENKAELTYIPEPLNLNVALSFPCVFCPIVTLDVQLPTKL